MATLANVACATLTACRAGLQVEIYGFDLVRARLYHGKKFDPKKTVALDSTFREGEWVALTAKDLKDIRTYCGVTQ